MAENEEVTPIELEVVVKLRYHADPFNYGTDDIKKMAEIDKENFINDPSMLFEILESDSYDVEVNVTEED